VDEQHQERRPIEHAAPGEAKRESRAVAGEHDAETTQDPDPPERWQQDTQRVEGEAVINPPPETELIQRSKVQG
jgi:hypothetical protein